MTAALIIVSLGVFVFLSLAGVGLCNYLVNKSKDIDVGKKESVAPLNALTATIRGKDLPLIHNRPGGKREYGA